MRLTRRFFRDQPRGLLYRSLIEWLTPRSAELWLIVRHEDLQEQSVEDALDALEPWQRAVQPVSEWPGTRLLAGTATCHRYSCTPSAAAVVATLVDGLYDWQQPELPEDLSFMRDGGSPLLATVAHEREAYLELTPEEEAELRMELPAVFALLDRPEES